MKKYMTFKIGFFTLLTVGVVVVAMHFIYVTPPVMISSKPFPDDRAADVQAIRQLEQTSADGWAAGDGELMASVYTEQADYVTFQGDWLASRAAIATLHQELFDTVLKGSELADREIRSIRFLADSVALVHMTGAIKTAGRSKPKKSRNSIQTLVAVKQNGIWQFTAFHNARIRRISLWEAITM